jgi:predicted metalloendopeptidase
MHLHHSIILLSLCILFSCSATDSSLESGVDKDNFDITVRPQDDFYRYVNGTWLDNTKIPEDQSTYGSFNALRDKARDDVRVIIEESSKQKNLLEGSDSQKVGDLYNSFMDEESLEILGVSPVKSDLEEIDKILDHDSLAVHFARMQKTRVDSPYGFYVSSDSKNPTEYIAYFSQSGLGLPEKAYYLNEDDKSKDLRSEYVGHLEKMFELFGFKEVESIASKVMAIETSIAKIHWTMVDRRDRDKTYNKLSTKDLRKLAPNLNWSFYLEEAGLANQEYFVVREKSYFSDFSNLFKLIPLEDWKLYLKWKLINSSAGSLNAEIDKQNFAFYGRTLNGTPIQEERWKRGTALISGVLGEVIGKIYVERHFKPEAKDRMIELVENLRVAYKEAIIDLDWMSDETKKQALDKLSKFQPKIGYPDKWKDYSGLEVGNNLINNLRQAALFSHQQQIDKLGKPIDRDEWFMTPQTVNAYYNPTMNEIVFPAAILQPPFFNMQADDAVNYGAIGGVIGHEMGHGFDDQGAKSDGDGVLRNWWTENDLKEFKLRTGKLADQYSKFEPLPGEFINGEMTLGENIGDLGGLTIAHKAYKLSLNDQESKIIDGLRGEERFFMGWAQVWAYKFREEALRNRLLTDSHSPAPYRCNGTLMNMPEFVEAYDLKESDKMYRDPKDRVKIW